MQGRLISYRGTPYVLFSVQVEVPGGKGKPPIIVDKDEALSKVGVLRAIVCQHTCTHTRARTHMHTRTHTYTGIT